MISSFNGVLRAAAIFGCAVIAGCGGGGGGGGGSTSPQNRVPVFGTVQFATTEEIDVSGQVTATDADGDALTFTKTGDPSKGTVTAFAANGTFTYRPNHDAFGSDSFAVRVADTQGGVINGAVVIQIAGVNDPPAPHDDTLTAAGAGIASLNVLANDVEVDGDALTVAIESAAEVGTATVNPDKTIAISGLPAGFRGVTRFKYKVTDPSNTSAVATAAVFIEIAPFRVIFPADEPGQDSPEVFITNLASAPVQLTQATEGTLRLRSMIAATNGSTVAYRRHDQAAGNAPLGLSFVRTADPATQVPIQLPNGMTLQPVSSGAQDSYVVSPNGQWIAGIVAKQPAGTFAVFLVNVAAPTVVHTATLPDTSFVRDQSLQFSRDSQHLYYIAAAPSDGGIDSLYRAAVATPDQSERMSALRDATGNPEDAITFYQVAPDQSKLLLWGGRGSSFTSIYYVNPANPRTEIRLTQHLVNPDDEIMSSVWRFDNANRIAYIVGSLLQPAQAGVFVAEISATPNQRPVGPGDLAPAEIRPDGQALLMSRSQPSLGLFEVLIDSMAAPTLVGDTEDAFGLHYDDRGDALIGQVFHDNSPALGYLTQVAAVRPTFGTIQQIGTPGKAALITNFTGTDRAVAIIGEGPQVQPVPPVQSVRLALANAWAPDKLLYLTDLLTLRTLKGARAAVVDP
jgi:Big-like domain-containing protein